MAVKEDFDQAVQRVKTLPNQGNNVLLDLYGLYKQATSGDVSGPAPGPFDLKGKAKHSAWASRKGMSKDQAMEAYVNYVNKLVG